EDRDFPNPGSLRKDNQVTVREDRVGDVTIWMRAGAQNEGKSGLFGDGESRFCFLGTGRTQTPLWRFSHQDASGWYMQSADGWIGGPQGACEQDFFNTVCGQPGFPSNIYAKSCSGHTGKQYGDILKNGVVKLPSGHTLNVLLVRTVADYCVYSDSNC